MNREVKIIPGGGWSKNRLGSGAGFAFIGGCLRGCDERVGVLGLRAADLFLFRCNCRVAAFWST